MERGGEGEGGFRRGGVSAQRDDVILSVMDFGWRVISTMRSVPANVATVELKSAMARAIFANNFITKRIFSDFYHGDLAHTVGAGQLRVLRVKNYIDHIDEIISFQNVRNGFRKDLAFHSLSKNNSMEVF